jgi:hypothetical protein
MYIASQRKIKAGGDQPFKFFLLATYIGQKVILKN